MRLLRPELDETTGPIGLLAGAGRFPVLFAEAVRRQGYAVHAVGVLGMADERLYDCCDSVEFVPVAKIGRAIRSFVKHGVKHAVMAGKIEKTVLFQSRRFWRLMPDWRALHMLYTYVRKNRKDDTLLLAVISEFQRDGITFGSALDFCPELLVKHGFLTRRKPTAEQWRDIRFGWEIAREMGRMDIGQSIVVNDLAVIAVEAIEGTDRCIQRAGELCSRTGFTVVKVAKPQQDMRFDVPAIGVRTIQTMHEAGARCLAIESGMTIMLDQDEVVQMADRMGIAIVSLNAEELQLDLKVAS